MKASAFDPTTQQRKVIYHDSSAFITACPGAGKTRTMVERARQILEGPSYRQGVAFLSFTNAAVDELEARLRAFGVLPAPLFPSFIGTFDRFLWQFLIVPFGMKGCDALPRLVPDKNSFHVRPFDDAQPLPLKCFDRATGAIDPKLALEAGFNTELRSPKAYETAARHIIDSTRTNGLIDFDDVRVSVSERLADKDFSQRVGAALAARFCEIFVDEAQDCNPADLAIVDWLMKAGITVKVVCDPNQSIYKFRGGVTDELLKYADTFSPSNRLSISGNFRSTPAICAAIVALRPPSARLTPDEPTGPNKFSQTPIHVISYGGSGVPPAIGRQFTRLALENGIPLHQAPVLASTRSSAAKAIGQPILGHTSHMTLQLAEAVMNYQFAFAVGSRREALVTVHKVVLQIQAKIATTTEYDNYLQSEGIVDATWRPEIIKIANGLRFDPFDTPDQWLEKARTLLASGLIGSSTINQRLRNDTKLVTALATPPENSPPARTIHSVKGLEFPGVCVVLTSKTSGQILDLLEGNSVPDAEEEARKIYVGCSRAERLLAIAVPKSRASRLVALLTATGCSIKLHNLENS
ncbi:ATP-dependent helicase [Bradyrhizobium sp. 40]|uniref:UvrD-helicase domain-containing protein n=1 Tax=Bradyrhizobium sp. 40 TaxID=2782674 RepID=UPI001FFFE07D|nr:ATP-dependent helicase [Bradyrhizobium sp. 40]